MSAPPRRPQYISQRSISRLKEYSYKGVDKSILSKHVLNPFWNQFVKIWPTWVAPNTITFIGLCTIFFNFATLIYYDPAYLAEKGGATGPPSWVYYTWAAGLFFYQSMDAIDGKQARRTGMAGPLGEMFDHGCDAMNTTLEVILAARALNLGRSWWTVASQVASLMNFYLTTWEEWHTGQLFLGVFSGPVEGILLIVVIYVITGYYGTSFWDQGTLAVTGIKHLPLLDKLPDIPLNEAFMVFGAVGLGFNVITSYTNVYKSCKEKKMSVLRPLAYLLPFPFTVFLYVSWLAPWQAVSFPSATPNPLDPGATLEQKTTPAPPGLESILNSELFVPFLCAWGLQFAHQVGKMILAHVTKSRFPVWDWMWVWLSVGALDWNARTLFGRAPLIQTSPERTRAFIWFTVALTFASYVRFCYMVIGDITNYLGIACFTVRKKDENGEWRTAQEVNAKKVQ